MSLVCLVLGTQGLSRLVEIIDEGMEEHTDLALGLVVRLLQVKVHPAPLLWRGLRLCVVEDRIMMPWPCILSATLCICVLVEQNVLVMSSS